MHTLWAMVHRTAKLPNAHSFFLFGARGTGKSTLLKSHFNGESCLYIDLLKLKDRAELQANPDSLESRILPQHQTVILDEIQRAPAVLDTVHRLIESTKLQFVLTGSSARKLRAGGANLLAGRAFTFELYPLTSFELGWRMSLEDMIRWGSLPKLLSLDSDEDKKLFLESYALTYLKEEVWDEHLVRRLEPFRKFLEVAAQNSGTIVNYSAVARDVGVDTKTVQEYYQILEDTLLSITLEPYADLLRKRQRSNPKVYLFDIGVTRALTKSFALEAGPGSFGFGYLFEQYLVTEIHRLLRYHKRDFSLHFYRDAKGLEVDLVVERPGMPPVLIEIKATQQIRAEHVENLQKVANILPASECFCFSLDETERRFGEVRALHWSQGLQALGLTSPG